MVRHTLAVVMERSGPGPVQAAVEGARTGNPAAGGLFVGRERELAELDLGLRDALAGDGRLFLLAGQPGVGKSRLADAASRRAEARGCRALWGSCWEGGGAPAYWPDPPGTRQQPPVTDADNRHGHRQT